MHPSERSRRFRFLAAFSTLALSCGARPLLSALPSDDEWPGFSAEDHGVQHVTLAGHLPPNSTSFAPEAILLHIFVTGIPSNTSTIVRGFFYAMSTDPHRLGSTGDMPQPPSVATWRYPVYFTDPTKKGASRRAETIMRPLKQLHGVGRLLYPIHFSVPAFVGYVPCLQVSAAAWLHGWFPPHGCMAARSLLPLWSAHTGGRTWQHAGRGRQIGGGARANSSLKEMPPDTPPSAGVWMEERGRATTGSFSEGDALEIPCVPCRYMS